MQELGTLRVVVVEAGQGNNAEKGKREEPGVANALLNSPKICFY